MCQLSSFNNLIIKNQYLLFLIDKLFNCLSYAKYFNELNLTNAYDQIKIKKKNK